MSGSASAVADALDRAAAGLADAARALRGGTPSSPEPSRSASASTGALIPGGRSKGTPIEDAEERDLTYWIERLAGDLKSGKTEARYRARDEKLLAHLRSELDRRSR